MVVILFNGFPAAYSRLSITFHIPITLMLVGLFCAGCAFTFRHYDAVRDDSQRYYNAVFAWSSLLSPWFWGHRRRRHPGSQPALGADLRQLCRPWCNLFCASLGLLVCALFAFLAAVYLLGETADPALRPPWSGRSWRRRARSSSAVCWCFCVPSSMVCRWPGASFPTP